MGRFLSEAPDTGASAAITTATKVVPASYMGEFGSGLWRAFSVSATFTVPPGVKSMRGRCVGGGGGAYGAGGGGGGGYAHGEFSVTPGQSISITVGAAGAVYAGGGTSSIGAFMTATGGGSSPGGGSGGVGAGGDFRASGGNGSGGGGGAGSQLGDGGAAGNGGGGVSGGAGGTDAGGRPPRRAPQGHRPVSHARPTPTVSQPAAAAKRCGNPNPKEHTHEQARDP